MVILTGIINIVKNQAAKSIGIYTFTNFFSKGVSFLLIPLFTNPVYLTTADNGSLSLLNACIIFFVPFISMGLVQSTSTDFFKLNKSAFADFFTTSLLLPVLLTLISIGLLSYYRNFLIRQFGFPFSFAWLIPLLALLTFCHEQLLALIRNNKEPYLFLGVSVVKTIIELGLAVALVVFYKYHWQGRVIGISTAYIFMTFVAFAYFYKKGYLSGKITRAYIKSELIYAVPIIVLQLSIFVMSSADKFFLSYDHDLVGVYSVAGTFASIILILSGGLLQYIFPKIYALLSEPEVQYSSIRKHFYWYVLIMLGGTVGLLLFTNIFYKLFINVKYHQALRYIYLIVLGYFAWTVTYFFYSFMLFKKQKLQILFLSILSIFVSLGSNYYFVRLYGDTGAAIAVCCCYFLMLFITIFVTRPHWKQLLAENGR